MGLTLKCYYISEQCRIVDFMLVLLAARFYDVNIKAEYQLSTTYNPTAFLSYKNNVRFTLKDAFKNDYKSSAIKIIPYDGKIRFEFVNEKKYMCAHKLTDDTTIFLDRNNSEDKLCEWEITGEENPHQFRIRDMCLTVQSRNRVANYHEVRLELCTDNVDQLINIAEMEKHDDDSSDEGYQSGSKSSKRKNQISSSTEKLKEETKKLASERKKLSKSISQNNSDNSKDDKSDNEKKKDGSDPQSTKINVVTINKTETVTFTTTATSSTTQISTIIKSTTTTVSATNSTTTTLTDTVHVTNTITDTVTTTSTAKPEKVRTAKYEKLSKDDDDDESSSSSDEEEIAELPFKISNSVTLKSVDGVEGSNDGKTNIDSESRVSANTRSKSKLKNGIHDDEQDTKKGLKMGRSASNLPDTRRMTGKPNMQNNKHTRDIIDDRPYNPVEDLPNSNDVQVEDDSSSKTDEYQIDYNAKKDEISISTDPDEDSVKIKGALHGNRNKDNNLNNANNAEGFKIEGILKGNVNKINSNTNVDKLNIDGTINGVATKGNSSPTANDIKININRNKDENKENKNLRSGTINLKGKANEKAINLNKNRKEGTINLRSKAKDNKINIGGTPTQDTANDTSKELKININSKPTDDAKQDESKDASDNLKININNKAEEDTGRNDSNKDAPKESSSAASKDVNIDINNKTKEDAPKNDSAGTNNNNTKSVNAPKPQPVNDSKPNGISGRSAMMNTPSPGNGNPAMRNNMMMMNASL